MPKNLAVINTVSKNLRVIDVVPKNLPVEDVVPKNLGIESQTTTRSYQVAFAPGVIKLSVPLLTFSSPGTETQWSESGGVF